MRSKRNMWVAAACLMSLFLLASCDTVGVYGRAGRGPEIGHGPPPHANAYGHRHRHIHGYDLVYDVDCGVYIVVGMTDWYYYDGYFYRLYGGVWEVSIRADRWEPAGHDRLPSGLRLKAKPVAVAAGHGNYPVKLNGSSNNTQGKGKSVAKGRK